jgi:Staphylococcal nuclease homologue
VILPDGTNVNHMLVREGWCWGYRKYAPGDTVLEGLETEAREARKGLWADPQPVPPWEGREIKKLGVIRTDWLFALTQASIGGDRHTEKVYCLHPATVNTTQPGMELREAGHDYPW